MEDCFSRVSRRFSKRDMVPVMCWRIVSEGWLSTFGIGACWLANCSVGGGGNGISTSGIGQARPLPREACEVDGSSEVGLDCMRNGNNWSC